ncbi:MAG: hypothetical protein LQ338_002622 [Usnochroma carphineum]|nr:MAG: hypothetical protein LQ338_002622 [Usnochroma carphineum]
MARSVLICALTLTLSSFVLAAFLIRPPSPTLERAADGVCALEVLETPAAQGTYLNLFAAAEDMIDVCMEFANPTEGSIATNIGTAAPDDF